MSREDFRVRPAVGNVGQLTLSVLGEVHDPGQVPTLVVEGQIEAGGVDGARCFPVDRLVQVGWIHLPAESPTGLQKEPVPFSVVLWCGRGSGCWHFGFCLRGRVDTWGTGHEAP